MKILKWAITLIIAFAVFAIFLFPYEAYLKNLCRKLEKERGITVNWENGNFHPWKTELKGVNIQIPDKADNTAAPRVTSIGYDKTIIMPFLTGLRIKALKDDLESQIVLTKDNVEFDIKGLNLPNVLNLGGGSLWLKGRFNQKDKTGEGNFALIVNNLILKNYAGKASFTGSYSVRGGGFNLIFTASGSGITGDGEAYIPLDRPMENAPMNGTAYFYYGNIGKKFNITGTIKNISLTEE